MTRNRMGAAGVLAAALAVLAALAGAEATAAETPPPAPPPVPAIDVAKSVEQAIERAADIAGPAVVNILVVREAGGPMGLDEGGDPEADPHEGLPDELRRYFDQLRRSPNMPFRAQGNGSGVIISPDGVILTSEHVVRDASEIEVTVSTRQRYRATVVGADARRDLAVIRIDATGLPAARLGDAARLRRGQFVLALGSPFGFGRDGQASLSFGIVSGTGRAIPGIGRELDRYYGNLVQTDAAVNPGNSGGPLVNLDGEVVGVNAVISSQSGTSDGVGFAVPITASTRALIERLRRGEEIVYGYIGVLIQEVGEQEARDTGTQTGQGAYVGEVLPDGPGAKAGLREGDVIVGIGQDSVHDPDDVIQRVQVLPVGEKADLEILRKGKREHVTVEVARRPVPQEVLAARTSGQWWRGMRVETLSAELREQIGLEADQKGVFVREVRDGSPAAKAGILPGMVVERVGETDVAAVGDFRVAVAALRGACRVHLAGIGTKDIPAPEGARPDARKPEGTDEKKPEDPADKKPDAGDPKKPDAGQDGPDR